MDEAGPGGRSAELKRRDRFALGVLAVMSLLAVVRAETATEPSALSLQQAVTIALEESAAQGGPGGHEGSVRRRS